MSIFFEVIKLLLEGEVCSGVSSGYCKPHYTVTVSGISDRSYSVSNLVR
ncbi:hypothetical protein [Okeania sp. KiyG1]|nr:hypothetical protein [Okeania sp. KiyG1]